MARSYVVAWSCNASGHIMGKAHANPIMNTRMYQVDFGGGKVTELFANVIAQSMYTQCDADGNEYLLLDVLIDYQKDGQDISLTDQQIRVWGRLVTYKTTVGWQICCQ